MFFCSVDVGNSMLCMVTQDYQFLYNELINFVGRGTKINNIMKEVAISKIN